MVKITERVNVVEDNWNVWGTIVETTSSHRQEEAFYILDIGDIVNKFRRWKQKMPRVEPFYAVKCNDQKIILEVLAALGVNFDCASKAEINQILDLNVKPERIIFANPAKPASHIRYAMANDVNTMTFDSEFELVKIKKCHPEAGLVLRIRCDAKVAQCPLGFKFGCDPVLEAPRLLKQAFVLGLNVVGISFHVGSGCGEPEVFSRAIAHAANLFSFGQLLGFKMDLLDIGGGFPGGTGSSIDEIAEIVNAAIDKHFPEDSGVRIIAEPGRYFVASAFTLACCIHAKRQLYDEEGAISHAMYFINDGVYGSFNCMLYDHQQVTAVPLKEHHGESVSTSIWGPTCDSMDQIAANIQLPHLDVGEWLVFHDMGAYTLPVASPFNGFPIPQVQAFITYDTWCTLRDLSQLNNEHSLVARMDSPTPLFDTQPGTPCISVTIN